MTKDEGWVKLYRELLEKPIWLNSTSEQRSVLIAILLMVNHEPKQWEWRGEKFTANPGQTVTSAESICKKAGKGISRQNVRSSLNRFKKLDFLTYKPTKQGTLITVLNWGSYQSAQPSTQPSTQPRPNQDPTTNKNDKNERNIKTPISPLREYLEKTIEKNGYQAIKDQIIVFFKYRQAKPKAKQYQSEKGINGLFRDLAGCAESGLNLFDCLEIAMENNWQTIKPDYFKKNGGNNGTVKHNYTGADNRPPVLGDRDLVI